MGRLHATVFIILTHSKWRQPAQNCQTKSDNGCSLTLTFPMILYPLGKAWWGVKCCFPGSDSRLGEISENCQGPKVHCSCYCLAHRMQKWDVCGLGTHFIISKPTLCVPGNLTHLDSLTAKYGRQQPLQLSTFSWGFVLGVNSLLNSLHFQCIMQKNYEGEGYGLWKCNQKVAARAFTSLASSDIAKAKFHIHHAQSDPTWQVFIRRHVTLRPYLIEVLPVLLAGQTSVRPKFNRRLFVATSRGTWRCLCLPINASSRSFWHRFPKNSFSILKTHLI